MFNFVIILYSIVQEKELKLRQGMKMMGLSVNIKIMIQNFSNLFNFLKQGFIVLDVLVYME